MYNCPMCNEELTEYLGERMHLGDRAYGITLGCENMECSAQEVIGHGKKAKDAYDVIVAKFIGREKSDSKRVDKKK